MALSAILGLALVGALIPAAASAAECTDTWTGPAEGAWSNAANWSTGKVPTATTVACIGSGKTVKISSGPNEVEMIQGEGSLVISSNSLELRSTAEASTIGGLTMAGNAILKGPGTLDISGWLNWAQAGYMRGSGATVILPGATATVALPSVTDYARVEGRRIVNEGIFTVSSGHLILNEGSELLNAGIFNANGEELGPAVSMYGAGATFVNTGTTRKTVGTGTSVFEITFRNEGTVDAQTGSLSFRQGGSGTSGSSWESALGSSVKFLNGTFNLKGGGLVGSIFISDASCTVNAEGVAGTQAEVELTGSPILNIPSGNLTVKKLTVGGGAKIQGSGTLGISASLNWPSQAYMRGSGSTVILPGATATMTVPNTGYGRVEGRRIVNNGTFTVSSGHLILNEGSELLNTGTFNANTEEQGAAVSMYGAGATFVNAGTTQKTVGTGTSTMEISFVNSGAIRELSGHLKILFQISAKASTATPHHACAGDPVDCGTGNFTQTQTDLEIGGRGVGLDLTRTYSAQAAKAGSLSIFGYGWTNSFGDTLVSEESGAKQTLTGASGGTTTFSKSGATWIAPSWSQNILIGSAETGFTLTLPSQTKEKFNGSGRLESVTDRNGNETTLAYNGSGKLESITDPAGRKIILTYNGEGLVEKAKDPMGHEVKYAYEAKQLKSVTLAGEASPSWQFKYDASHRMTSMTDGRGGKTTNEYNASGQVIAQTDPSERKTTWEYAPFHTKITNKATGAVTDEWFNSNNQPMSITRGSGTALATTESFTYTAAGLLASKTDGNGHTATYGYDAEGNTTSLRDAEGDETRWTFNGAHQILTATRPNGEETTIVRDPNGNPETISRPAPSSETQLVAYEYGPHGEVESMTDPLGHAWTFGYDKYGDRTAATDPEGDERTWAYNEDSQVTSTVSPRGNEEGAEAAKFTTSIERDAQGRPIKVTDPLGGTTKTAYDADGNVESITDPNGRKTKLTYDADNELTKVEYANKAVEETGYDGAGAVTSQTDGNKQKTTYVRNILEQPVETIDPLERKTIRTFDAAGDLKTLKDPNGRTTTYSYDKADRLTGISYSDGITPNATFAYDKDGNRTGMVDGTGESTYEYDQLGRLTHSENGHGETVAWTYNLADEPVGLTYPNGKSIARAYDKAGRLESVTDWLGHTTSFAYNRDSAPTTTTFPVATTDTDEYGYDRADRMASVTMKKGAETLASLAYTRDPAGQIESLISKGLPGAETESFSYDENERLTKAGAAEFGYDAANNPTKAPGTTNAFDKASQLESATGATFSYDKEGERTKQTPSTGPATTYKYDQAGDLTAVERAEEGETPAVSESFAYDGTGLMASRTVGLTTKHLVWDVTEAPEALLSDGDESYLYGPGGLAFEQISSEGVPTYLHHDQLGSTRLLTDGSGETAGTFTYGPYGASTGETGTATTALGYAGQYTLGQSGLQYLRARYYDPATAQFLTLDPEVGATRAPYFYAGDNPANRRDRTGQAEEGIDGCFGCLPLLPTQEQGERALEGLGEIGNEVGDFIGGLFGGGSSSAPAPAVGVGGGGVWPLAGVVSTIEATLNEADDEASDDVPCAEETKTVIGDRGQEMTKASNFLKQIEIAKGSNPQQPSGGPRWTRIAALIAELWRHLPR